MNYVEQLAGDIYGAAHGRSMPDSERLLYLFYAGLALAVGTSVTPEQVHDAWCAWACWQHAEHPCLMPFAELAPVVRKRDEPYADAIRAIMARRGDAQAQGGKPGPYAERFPVGRALE
jgi:hypothetical protein